MIASVSGTVDGHELPPRGVEVDLPDHVAAALCDAGQARPVSSKEKVETAAMEQEDVEERAEGQTVGETEPGADARPSRSDSKAAWVDYAVSQRGDGVSEEDARAEADGKLKADLIAEYGG
jgi:hypothetical protein